MNFKRFLFYLILLIVFAGSSLYIGINYWLSRPVILEEEKLVNIPSGLSGRQIGNLLASQGVVSSSDEFRWAIWFVQAEHDLKSGTIKLIPPLTRRQLVEQIQGLSPLFERVTVPQGWPSWRIIPHLARSLEFSEESLNRLFYSQKLRDEFNLPGDSLEGYLFPDTYFFSRDAAETEVIRQILSRFSSVARELNLREKAAEHELDLLEAVTLASIIEREARVFSEKPKISAVFHNRLARGMRLEADPTVLYALGDYQHRLSRQDLRIENPYNTYFIQGFPPGPICSPGADSLRAAVDPTDSDAIFFVARGDGTHQFSRTYQEHRRAIRQFR